MNINNEDFEINMDLLEKEKLVKKINENINSRDYIKKIDFEKSNICIEEEEDNIEKDILELYLLSEIELEKKILKNKGLLGNLKYLGKKIIKSEGYLYEEQGDTEGKNKKWKEAEKKYQMSKDNMELLDVSTEDKKRVEKKLKNATKKANKKWWEFWK